MKNYKVVFSNDARQDLKAIVKYIKNELKETKAAERIAKKIKDSVIEISKNPIMYAVIDDDFIKRLELRKKVVGNYIVFYKVIDEKKEVQIVRILYGKRDWSKML